jgi:hypothetical protein
MKNLSGWQLVSLVGLLLAALVALVAMGQTVSALVAAGLVVASALGVPIYQGAVNRERIEHGNALSNGNLDAMRKMVNDTLTQAAEERAEFARVTQQMQQQMVELAKQIPTDVKPDQF